MAPHSSTLAWKIPWTEEPGGLQFIVCFCLFPPRLMLTCFVILLICLLVQHLNKQAPTLRICEKEATIHQQPHL